MISPLVVIRENFDSFFFVSPDNVWSTNLDTRLSAVFADVLFHTNYYFRGRRGGESESEKKLFIMI